MTKKALIYIFIINIFWPPLFALTPVTPDRVLTTEEIDRIIQTNDYFFYREMDDSTPIWFGKNRKYGAHSFGQRNIFFTLDDVLHRTLTDGFPIQYQTQQLYRSRYGIHAAVGNILPKINLAFGSGVAAPAVDQIFTGALSFLWPVNWLKLTNQVYLYDATKYILLKTVLDQILSAKILYIHQHQLIQEFEIINYYFIHLQLWARQFPQSADRILKTILGTFAVQGTNMASQRGATKLGFDDLALFMALEKSKGDYTANTINIADLEDFPSKVKDIEELEPDYKDKRIFLEKVVQRSIELKIINEFLRISRLNIGITATGSMFTVGNRPVNTSTEASFAFQFGYETLPNILIASSFYDTTRIDVRSEYIKMLDYARRSFDLYTNSLGGYTEAKRALQLNRDAFKQNLQHFIDNGKIPDAYLVFSISQLIESELKLNNALHGSLIARANMDRFLLVDSDHALKHLPQKGDIIKIHDKFVAEYTEEVKYNEEIDTLFVKVRSSKELHNLLNSYTPAAGVATDRDAFIVEAVKRNIGNLLFSKWTFIKSKKFFQVLHDYTVKHGIELTHHEEAILHKKLHQEEEPGLTGAPKVTYPNK